ncbi:MAG: hypothetical protein IKI38_01985, partial [Mogibacterium sp.]|nr:hypothetical protein [Mogibacterium sp.]
DTGKGIHVSSRQEAAVIMAYLRSKSSGNRVKASVGSKTRSSDPLIHQNSGSCVSSCFFVQIIENIGKVWDILLTKK